MLARLWTALVAAGQFLDEHNGAVTAIATIFIAAFTVVLALVTHRQARLTRIAAEAARDAADTAIAQLRVMIATESPIFTWVGFGLEPVSGDAGGIMPDREYRATATVKNVGRSPLELRAVCIETMLGQEERHSGFGAIPKYTDIVNAGHVLEAGKEVRFYSVKRVKFTADEAAGVKNLSRHFWIYGFVRYFNRFTDEVCDAGFSVMRTDSGFHRIGIPNYNYDRRQKANPDKPVPFPYQT